jgi:hypothetical protein
MVSVAQYLPKIPTRRRRRDRAFSSFPSNFSGRDILKIANSKAHYFFKLGREKNIFVKFVFIKGWQKSEQTPPFLKTMKTCVENLKIV